METYGIVDFYTYLAGVIAIILLPGPNSMYCLYVAISRGVVDAYKVVAAIFIADTTLMLASILGAATLLKTSPLVFTIFKGLGGLYLLYLGYGLLVGAWTNLKQKNNTQQMATQSMVDDQHQQAALADSDKAIDTELMAKSVKPAENVFIKAFLLGMSNPKAIVFFISFFLQFVDADYAQPLLSFAILGVILQVISMAYLSVLIFTGRHLLGFFKQRKYLVFFGNAGVGVLFISFAISLWLQKP